MENLKSQLNFLTENEAKEIIEEAQKQAANIIAEANEKAEKTKKREIEQIMKDLETDRIRDLQTVESEQKRKMMKLKLSLIEAVFAASLENLRKMAEKQVPVYRANLESFILEAITHMQGSQFEIILSSEDSEFMRKKIQRIEEKLSETRKIETTVKISNEALRSIGGVVARSLDGKQIFNNTLEARLDRVRQARLPEITNTLFKGAET